MHYDVIIIGGGPGGTTAAKELAAGGKKVAIIEDKHWGGTCLNCGCIPTKMLLGATAPLGLLKAQERLRTMKGSIDIDYRALQTRVGRFLKGSSQTLAKSLAAAGITLYEGRGVCAGKGQAIVRSESGEEMLTSDNIILSCGSSSASFPGLQCIEFSVAVIVSLAGHDVVDQVMIFHTGSPVVVWVTFLMAYIAY